MKRNFLKYLKVSAAMLSVTGMLFSTGISSVNAEENVAVENPANEADRDQSEEEANVEDTAKPEDSEQQAETTEPEAPNTDISTRAARYMNANIDIVDGKQVRMPVTNTGVVVDGHQLNHDYVKILNINNGTINLYDESYSQGSVNEPWTTQEDAYVIKGQGTSANNITINPTKNEITVYLVDLQWNGQIVVNGNATKVNLVVCGTVENNNASYTINIERQNGNLAISGLKGREDILKSNILIFNYYAPIFVTPRTIDIKDITLNTNSFITNYVDDRYYDSTIKFDNVVLNNNGNFYRNVYSNVIVNNSILNQVDFKVPSLTSTDSVIKFKNAVIGTVNSKNSTLALNSGTASNFPKINLENTSLYSAINFIGTPVDKDAEDLFVKKIRLREFPNTFVYISVDNGPEARLQTDANGYLYPYVKKGTTRIDARLEDGRTLYAAFAPTTGADNTTTNLIKSTESVPVINSTSSDQTITVGDRLSLSVSAAPGTSGKSLSYQWYKNDQIITGATSSTYTKNESVTGDSGTYKCSVKEDGGGTSTSGNIVVVVNKAESPNKPVISNMTSDMDLVVGSSITLTVNAHPSVATNGLSYQWYFNNSEIGTESNKLTLTKVKPTDAGTYKCVITEENFNSTVETGTINITVSNPQ